MADELDKTIVIDNGSGVVKAGLAGEAIPSVIFPSVIGQPFQQEDPTEEVLYVGDGVAPLAGGVKVRYPLAEGKIKRWDDIELIWDHTFNLLEVEPSYHPVLLTEPPLNPLKNREKMIEIMFEKYQVPGFYVAVQAVLSLYASGRTTGIVMDCGDGVSHTVPVYEGYAIPHAIRRLDVAGRNLTEYMQRLLMLRGYSFTTSAEMELVREIKEKLCFVKHTPTQKQNKQSILATHELLSGEEITIDEERYMCPEALFNPSLIGREAEGIHKLVYSTIQSCDIDLRRDLYSNIILSGGSTMFPGTTERMQYEIEKLAPARSRIKVTAPPERKFSVWMGGSILGELATFKTMMITGDEYHEAGPTIVHRKCF